MSSLRVLSVLILGTCFAVTGCIADAQDPMPFDAEELEVPLEETGLGLGNGLLPAIFWNHKVQGTMRALATGPITDAAGVMPDMPDMLALPATHWKAIQDMVECALPATLTAKNPHTGAVYNGKAGLAAGWRLGPLDAAGRRWVTSCMIQRLNAFGVVVPTLQEGPHASMPNDPLDDLAYPFDESTATGDAFSSTMPLGGNKTPAFFAYVCSEVDQNKKCREPETQLDWRICDTAGSICGLHYLGPCNLAASGCVANGVYWACNGTTQTVRVQLQSGGACH